MSKALTGYAEVVLGSADVVEVPLFPVPAGPEGVSVVSAVVTPLPDSVYCGRRMVLHVLAAPRPES